MNKIKKIIITISLLIFILLSILIIKFNNIKIDDIVYNLIKNNIISDNTTLIMKIITALGSIYVIIPVILITTIILTYKKNKLYYNILIINTIVITINQILKHIIKRIRPENINLIIEKGYSFPSGHSMIAASVYGYLALLLIRSKIKFKYIYATILVLLILLIAFSRIYLGVHYFTDCLAGILLSTILILIIDIILEKNTIK